jgi:hypothetical protein
VGTGFPSRDTTEKIRIAGKSGTGLRKFAGRSASRPITTVHVENPETLRQSGWRRLVHAAKLMLN